MRVPIHGNKWSHQRTRIIRANAAAQRRKLKAAISRRQRAKLEAQQTAGPEKCECGRFKGEVVCQCRIDQVRREMVAGEQIKMCLEMNEGGNGA